MKIIKIQVFSLNMPFKLSWKTPLGVIDKAANVVIKITTDKGNVGWGEASPFSAITGDSQDTNLATAKHLAAIVLAKNPLAIEQRMAEINAEYTAESSIRSAYDMALYDILAQAANMPLYELLGGEKRTLQTDFTIGMQDSIEQTLFELDNLLSMGFDAIKMKVGRSGLQDVAHVKAVREKVGNDVLIKIDSNQGWDYPTACANLKAMEPLNIQYSEQPIAAWDYDNLVRLRKNTNIPICVDESVFDDHDALKLIKLGAADYLNIKLGKSGGIHTALRINAIAQAAGNKCMIGCFAESRLALTACAHLACARPNIEFIDLDSAYLFKQDPVIGGLHYGRGGLIELSDSPGLGAIFDESFLKLTHQLET